MSDFYLELKTSQPDVEGDHGTPTISLGDNNGVKEGAPVYFEIVDDFGDAATSLTLDELTRLRNMLNEAIVWAEGELAR